VDVASKELLLGSLADVAASTGAGVLLCSDELSDLAVCDRVVVLVRGEVFTEFSQPPFDRDELILATEGMTGGATTMNGPVGDVAVHPAEEAAQ
jgi:simple sugar transport system ATP-binding protein